MKYWGEEKGMWRGTAKLKVGKKGSGYQMGVCLPRDSLEKYTTAPKVLGGLCS